MMQKLLWILVYTLLFGTCGFADGNVEEIVSKLQKKYDSIRDVAVVFTENVVFGVTKSEQSFNGKLFMKKGNKYIIEMEQQTIVTDGKSVWSYTKINKQVLIDKYKDDPNSFSPDKILVNVPNNFVATLLGEEKISLRRTSILKLVPKNKKANIQWMKVWIDNDDWLMRRIQVLDISDNLMTYLVSDIKINTGIADSQFQFDVPEGVEIIDLR